MLTENVRRSKRIQDARRSKRIQDARRSKRIQDARRSKRTQLDLPRESPPPVKKHHLPERPDVVTKTRGFRTAVLEGDMIQIAAGHCHSGINPVLIVEGRIPSTLHRGHAYIPSIRGADPPVILFSSVKREPCELREQMRLALKVALKHCQKNLVIGMFGVSEQVPATTVSKLWRDLLAEFLNQFEDVIFALPTQHLADTFRSNLRASAFFPCCY
ncbi:hypothetical protein BU24DRAFT_477538 [Aaosphaeria arxii CBS 175.79]|uniref:Macro domain-containing protein n=1 Tax=Aaosphaeria arxii CBS 175.79 TaxID=1450172 RepID=A0A6A5Y4Y7_9PLEO|nr:uncharacterized protein BU24DRAFT_477538 [Aaosphaeria arxii CBS 175.79]KAF2020329.1 hypothetical protein BU24DRAFT_477538 [Aaosphaeria arxii CBS 175.79]